MDFRSELWTLEGLHAYRGLCAGCALHWGLCAVVKNGCARGCAWVVRRLCSGDPPSRRSRILNDAHYSVSRHTNPFKFYYLSELRPMISYSSLLPFTPYWRGLRGFWWELVTGLCTGLCAGLCAQGRAAQPAQGMCAFIVDRIVYP